MPAEFGLATAVLVVVASMVVVGVLTTSGYTMALVGSNQLMLILWIVGGVIAVCGALALAELSAALPHTGGDYFYLYHAFGFLAAFLSGWVSFLIGFSGPCAAAAFGSAKYILAPYGLEGNHVVLTQRIVASFSILFFAFIHVSGRERTARVQGWITGLKLAVLGVLIVAGLAVGWPHGVNLQDPKPVDASLAITMLYAVFARLRLLCVHRMEWRLLSRRRDSRSSEDPAAGDPNRDGRGDAAVPGREHCLCAGPLGR